MTEDPRKTALKHGLRQLRPHELKKLLLWASYGGKLLLDRDEDGNTNRSRDGVYCPLAVAVGAFLPTDVQTANYLKHACGFDINNTRGVPGEFYTTDRRGDLLIAAEEVLKEKRA